RSFTEQLVQQLAEEPQLGLDSIEQWSDEDLLRVALAWAEAMHKRYGRKFVRGSSFAGFVRAMEKYLFPSINPAAEQFSNLAGLKAVEGFTASTVASALGFLDRDLLGSSLARSLLEDLSSGFAGAAWSESQRAAEQMAGMDVLGKYPFEAVSGVNKQLLDQIAAQGELAQHFNDRVHIGNRKYLDDFLKSNAAEILEQQQRLSDIVGSFGATELINKAFLQAGVEAVSFLDAIRADELLYDHLAGPVSSASEFARAILDVERLRPVIEVPESVLQITEHFSAMEDVWRNSAWDTLRVSAPLLDSAAAIFEQDWLFNSASRGLMDQLHVEGDAQVVLSEHGFGFTVLDLLEWPTLRLLAERRGQGKANAMIVRRLTSESQKESFREALADMFQQMSTLPRKVRDMVKPRTRWRAIHQALDAHQRRHYYTSVPVLIAQVDGLLTCLLVARGELWPGTDKWGKKIFLGVDLSKPGSTPMNADSLRKRLRCTALQSDPMLAELIDVLEKKLDERNGVLHGDDTEYGNAMLSSQMVWALAALAFQLAIIAEAHSRARGAKRAS
ncbi:MAG TPA: hypothetical protein VGE04_17085, partial [Chloroflexia bacterium]